MAKGHRVLGRPQHRLVRGGSPPILGTSSRVLQLAHVVAARDGEADRGVEGERQLRWEVLQQGTGRPDHRPIRPARSGTLELAHQVWRAIQFHPLIRRSTRSPDRQRTPMPAHDRLDPRGTHMTSATATIRRSHLVLEEGTTMSQLAPVHRIAPGHNIASVVAYRSAPDGRHTVRLRPGARHDAPQSVGRNHATRRRSAHSRRRSPSRRARLPSR